MQCSIFRFPIDGAVRSCAQLADIRHKLVWLRFGWQRIHILHNVLIQVDYVSVAGVIT